MFKVLLNLQLVEDVRSLIIPKNSEDCGSHYCKKLMQKIRKSFNDYKKRELMQKDECSESGEIIYYTVFLLCCNNVVLSCVNFSDLFIEFDVFNRAVLFVIVSQVI